MLGEELDKQVREYVRDLRAMGVTINTAVVLASVEGIIMHKDANFLQSIELINPLSPELFFEIFNKTHAIIKLLII